MKIQYLAVIFVIIILPISLVLNFYTQAQIDIVNKQTEYTSKLSNATYDAMKAFQLNTTNSYYSSISDSKIRDIEASVNTFYNSLAASLHYTKSELSAYVPAMVYTLYDGYYIYGKRYNVYTDTKVNESGELEEMTILRENQGELTDANKYEYGLKPFVYYSCRYKSDDNNDFIVNFTLDNFISIYGTIDGAYVTKKGYLINTDINENDVTRDISKPIGEQIIDVIRYKNAHISASEVLSEYLKFKNGRSEGIVDGEYTYVVYQNQKIYKSGDTYFWYDKEEANILTDSIEIKNAMAESTKSARQYYIDALNFSEWVNYNIGDMKPEKLKPLFNTVVNDIEFVATEPIFDTKNQDPEDVASTFNQHRIAIIKNAIVTNLIAAINSYNSNAGSYAYALPKLTEEDWEKVVNNVCIISFMQGLPIGGKYFNNYTVIPNDKNNEFVDIDSVYLLTKDGQYHMPNCPKLVEDKTYQGTIVGGYINTSFVKQTIEETYYYKHVREKNVKMPYTACYHCIVNASGRYDLENDIFMNKSNRIGGYDIEILRGKYLTILSREKYDLYKTNN